MPFFGECTYVYMYMCVCCMGVYVCVGWWGGVRMEDMGVSRGWLLESKGSYLEEKCMQ